MRPITASLNFLLVSFLVLTSQIAASQEAEQENVYHFNGTIDVTQNGFSFIPTFSLDKPATTVALNIGGDRFTFEPQFRFDLDGMRPWSMVGFWRYKLIDQEKFMMKLGVQFPAFTYRYEDARSGNINYTRVFVQRFAPIDVITNYQLTDKVSIGAFYLHSIGLEKADQLNSADFLAVGPTFSNLRLTDQLRFRWAPQLYFLRIDEARGYYYTHSVSLSRTEFPLSISSTVNAEIDSTIGAKKFNWNVSIVYSFANEFSKK